MHERYFRRLALGTTLRHSDSTSHLVYLVSLLSKSKEIIEAALRESGGRVSGPSRAAAKLGITGSTLESKIKSLKIDKYRFKTAEPSVNRIRYLPQRAQNVRLRNSQICEQRNFDFLLSN
jgi:hypothetical protein